MNESPYYHQKPNAPPLEAEASAPPVVMFQESRFSLWWFFMQCFIVLSTCASFLIFFGYPMWITYTTLKLVCWDANHIPFDEQQCTALSGAMWFGEPVDPQLLGEVQYLWHMGLYELAKRGVCDGFNN